ncbi:MAG: hypothetical protein A2166_04290 [Omnitrophica WOR_2 bacterium RBG_13_41_10]|nr:MAG: hypothetical protein A2166_04290 [Omnitrophica WOR_2 bacterium RBG_13_41_10]
MDKDYLLIELNELIGDYLKEQRLDLVEFIYRREGKKSILRILVDKPQGGITLDECASLNNRIGLLLDEKGLLQQSYALEVCSPGLDRPLETEKDFLRCLNKPIKIFLQEPIEGKWEPEGLVTRVENDTICLDMDGSLLSIPLLKIRKAKQIL